MPKLTGSDVPSRLPENEAEMAEYEKGNFPAVANNAPRVFDTDYMRSISSFNDAVDAAVAEFGDLADAQTEIGTGFSVLDREAKQSLCGVAFVILEWAFNQGDMGEFVSFVAVTEDNRRVIVNDGSTGIYAQLREYADRSGRKGGLLVKGGLRRSDYQAHTNSAGVDVPAGTTYYLNV